jgi:PAS domain S-box-containing protein
MPTADRGEQVPPGVFEALHHIGVAIGGVLEPFGLARLVSEHARGLLSANAVGLWLFDEQSGSLRALHHEQVPVPDIRPGMGLAGRAFTQREPVVVLDFANWEHALACDYVDLLAGIAVPLLVGGRAIGVLGVGFPESRLATSAAAQTLTLLAAQVAPAFEAARLYETARAELQERRRKEEALRFQTQLLEAVEHALIALALDGTIRYWNRAAEKIYGWRSEEALGRNAQELLLPEGLAAPGKGIVARVVAGESWSGVFYLLRRDGTVFPALVTDSPVRDEQGRVIGLIGASIDVSERVEATRRLEKSEQRFRAVWEHAADAMVLSGPDGIIQLVNPACRALYGLDTDELIGHDFTLIPPKTELAGSERPHRELFAAPQPPPMFQSLMRRSNGEECTVECRAEFVGEGGERVGLVTVVRDITERKRAEHEREALLEGLSTAQERVQELLARVLRPEEHRARSERHTNLEARVAALTPRERDVLRQLAAAKTNQEIGHALGLSSKAARNRVADVLAKLGVADRTHAAVLAVELGLTTLSP